MTDLMKEFERQYIREMQDKFHWMLEDQARGYLNGSGWDLEDAIRTAKQDLRGD